ncbi:TetR/AcrR family transcriptional regulator [bacterium]|nr:TetR/AcrR family transcriptional regulator [bacterium]
METRDLIIKKAESIFMRIGIKSVSMDDLARELGMSKKTIYQHFKDKRELVNTVFDNHLSNDKDVCNTCFEEATNAIEQVLEMSKYVHKSLEGMNPAVMYDIQKYYPNCWQKFQNFTTEFIFKNIKQNIIQGRKEGLYRENFNIDIVASIYVCLVQNMVQPGFAIGQNIEIPNLQAEAIHYHLNSICTNKGTDYLNEHLKL